MRLEWFSEKQFRDSVVPLVPRIARKLAALRGVPIELHPPEFQYLLAPGPARKFASFLARLFRTQGQ